MRNEKSKLKKLRRTQLDELYGQFYSLLSSPLPQGAWIRDIREALGMSATQLARRLGITPPALKKIEANESKLAIELRTLQRVAAAMDCRLVYALVPAKSSQGTLEAILRERARRLATNLVYRVCQTMALEEQAVSDKERKRQIDELTDDLIRSLDRRIWEVD